MYQVYDMIVIVLEGYGYELSHTTHQWNRATLISIRLLRYSNIQKHRHT